MTPAQVVTLVVLVLVVVLALLGMRRGWQRRAARSARTLPAVPHVPEADELGAERCEPVPATYVSTTAAGDWLERVVAHDLGVRSSAVVRVHDGGVVLSRTGAQDVFIPAAEVTDVRSAPGMAGKFVGGAGLLVLAWQVRPADDAAAVVTLETGLRTRRRSDQAVLVTAVRGLITGERGSISSEEQV